MPEERGDSRFTSFLLGFVVGVVLAAVGAGGYGSFRERQVALEVEREMRATAIFKKDAGMIHAVANHARAGTKGKRK